ncbi:hypothetical protein V7S43_011940 [Phytophthora oleae]|uniref:Uncharacterized protein n=1 Tax=Phytophthora oleae TaxID=2107226 RepID=A0ABD3F962_9STRA
MVRLTVRSFLHLLLNKPEQSSNSRSTLGWWGTVSREIALASLATAREVNAAEQLSFLRRPVSIDVDGQVHHDQGIAVEGGRITVNSAGDRLTTTVDHLSPVPPVVALLLERVKFGCDEWSDDDIEHVQSALLDGVLGRNGEVATNVIGDVFEGLMSPDSSPASDQLCEWVELGTGEVTQFLLQHAVDFAYFVDGGQEPVPDNVGPSFCRMPTRHVHLDDSHNGAEPEEVLELFNPFLDDDASPQDAEACAGISWSSTEI